MKRIAEITSIICIIVFIGGVAPTNATIPENVIVNGGFEGDAPCVGVPDSLGYWCGDSTEVVGNSDGITPYEDDHMVKFIYTALGQASAETESSQLWQIVDTTSYQDYIEAGVAHAQASAYFNRIEGDSNTDTIFRITLYAFDGLPSSLSDRLMVGDFGLANSNHSIDSDADTYTWEKADVDLMIPINTDYLVLHIAAQENVFNDAIFPEFDGHYADAVTLTITPEPATLLLLGFGGLALLRRRKQA